MRCYAYVVLTKKIKKRRSALKSKEIEGENSIQEANALKDASARPDVWHLIWSWP